LIKKKYDLEKDAKKVREDEFSDKQRISRDN
jgi:hypothetical protein